MTLIWSTWSSGARTCTAQLLTGERRADRCTVGLASGPCGAASRDPGGGSRIEPVQCYGASVGSALGYLICMRRPVPEGGGGGVDLEREREREWGEEQRKEETWTLHLRASRHRPACRGCDAAHSSRLCNTNRSLKRKPGDSSKRVPVSKPWTGDGARGGTSRTKTKRWGFKVLWGENSKCVCLFLFLFFLFEPCWVCCSLAVCHHVLQINCFYRFDSLLGNLTLISIP